ncbi:hypothetical protein EN852_033585 [Mesorhizobium sp. M2E.F.Ca.ET.209.01.1.1]|uniref:hypothetical protein n=1 Tax=Mesorhizobium sp. M2E.F.Ca.ET.209.01.1.1 TaxID=2500526 RepID=UPI000FD8B492|nr:hypothetical protein [Mesorhizobium sp. M2E.F.Ca.ET.209.01.1.1]TGS08811.1 hypothetical protein EN852_033585 [Mesorhizobium sp. M2E.F.Ca.ET.209.01.1.1]
MDMEGFAKRVSDTITVARIGVAGAIAAAVIAAWISYLSANKTFDASMVTVGVGILSQEPDGMSSAATRQWATDLVEKHSGLPFSPEAKEALKAHSLGGAKNPISPTK